MKIHAQQCLFAFALLLGVAVCGASGVAVAAVGSAASEPVDEVDIMALSPEIVSLLEARVDPRLSRDATARALMDLLFGRDGLDIVYGNIETKTAVETFESRSGNCLSFTILFVALARHVGLKAHFQEVGEILSWNRKGKVAVNNRHMFAEVQTASGLLQVDFFPGVQKRYRFVRRIGERRVLAHYYNNLGAEALGREEFERARSLLERSLEADEGFAAAWVNLGVLYRLLGDFNNSEQAYLTALEVDPQEMSAAANLTNLYELQGKHSRARPYLRMARRHQKRNPFHHFRLGLQEAARGNTEEAIVHLKRAVGLQPKDAFFRLELAQAFARVGRVKKAKRQLTRALAVAEPGEQRGQVEIFAREIRDGLSRGGSPEARDPP